MIYLKWEFKEDKIDSFLNFFIILITYWAIKKLMIDIFNDEDKVKISSSFSTIILLITILELVIRAYKEKNKKLLNFFSSLCLMSVSICRIIYGYICEELSVLIPNVFGFIVGSIYIGVWFYLKRKYGDIPEELKKAEDMDIKTVKIENNDKSMLKKKMINEEEEKIVNKNK